MALSTQSDDGGSSPQGEPFDGKGELWPLVYAQLRRIAQHRMAAQRGDHTLQATALVNEAYLRLASNRPREWQNEAHFYFAAARAMQDILLNHARARGRIKRGGDGAGHGAMRVPLDIETMAASADPDSILALRDAVAELEAREPEVAAVVKLRFYAGQSGDDVARHLNTSPRQVDRHWAYARTWLHDRMARPGD